MDVQVYLSRLQQGWETYKGIVGSLVASNVNMHLYRKRIKDMDAVVSSYDVTVLQTQLPAQWESCKAVHKAMIANNVNLVTLVDAMDVVDSCIQSIRESIENTSNWSDLAVATESNQGNQPHIVEERAVIPSSEMVAFSNASDTEETLVASTEWPTPEGNGATLEIPFASVPENQPYTVEERAVTPSAGMGASPDASDTDEVSNPPTPEGHEGIPGIPRASFLENQPYTVEERAVTPSAGTGPSPNASDVDEASNPPLKWPKPEGDGVIPEISSSSLPDRRRILDIFGSGKGIDSSSKVGRTRISVEQTEIRYQTVTNAQGRECHYCALAFLTTLAKGQNKRFMSCVIEFDFYRGQSEALSIESVLPSKSLAKPQSNHLPVSFSTEIGSDIQLSAAPFNSNLSLSGKWCKTFTIDYYSKFETEGSGGSKMVVRMEENKRSRCGAPSPAYFAVLLRLPTAECVFKASIKLEAKRSRNGPLAFPETIKRKEEVTFPDDGLD